MTEFRLAILSTHPIQYYSPWFAHMADHIDLHVYYAHQQTPEGQSAAGFSTAFDWDLPLLEGYRSTFLKNVARYPSLQSFLGCDTPEILHRLRTDKYDALLMFGWNKLSFLQGLFGARAAKIPVLIRLDSQLESRRGALKRSIKKPLYSFVLPRAAHYLSPGERSDAYLRHYCVPDRRIHRVPHMVDVERFAEGAQEAKASGAAEALREKYGAKPDDTIFLTVGKLIPKKRHTLILEALGLVGKGAGVTLWMIGDGPLEKEIDDKIINQKLNVKRLGFINQTELPRYYAAADCLILPSDGDETWGLVVNEAQACGLPAIVSNEAGCAPELIIEGVTGWTLHQPNPTALAELLTHVRSNVRGINRQIISEYANNSSYHIGTTKLISAISQIKKDECR